MNMNEYAKFLELSEEERYELFLGCKPYWWQMIEFKLINKWWSRMQRLNTHIRRIDLWESIYKGRF